MNRQLFASFIILFFIALASHNAFGDVGCRQDCEAPTLGILDDGRLVVEKGLTINEKSFDVTNADQIISRMKFTVDQPISVKVLVYENNGVSSLQHVSFTIADHKNGQIQDDKASISFDQDFTGAQKTSVTDFDKILDHIKVNATSIDSFTTSVVFAFKFQKPIDASSIVIDMWDYGRNSRKSTFIDALEIDGKSLEKNIEKNTVEKKTIQKKDQNSKDVVREKSSDNTKDKSKKITKKPQISKGKKKVQLPQQYEY